MKEKYDKLVQLIYENLDLCMEQSLYNKKDEEYKHIGSLILEKEEEILSFLENNNINKETMDKNIFLQSVRNLNNYK